ncbi:MAG TPA: serine hydrolase [Pirellulaceae bacterium]|jgi:CubicO group peptidase (beta-lactamase class C family)
MPDRPRFLSLLLAAIVAALQFAATRLPAEDTKRLTADQRSNRLESEVNRFFQPLVDRQWASGLVVGVIDERGPRIFGFGRKADDKQEAPDGDTVFEIGSVTKVFTGTLLADMVERGLLSVDDPVNKFLPDDIGPLKRGDREMRLIDLATHTSGLPRMPGNWSPKDMDEPYVDYTTENLFDFLREQAKPSVLRSVGKSLGSLFRTSDEPKWEYSNLGVGLLGTLLARKADQPYEDLVLDRICRPLGMTSTRLTPDESMIGRLIPGHDADGKPVNNWPWACLAPCGGLRSTANDMLKFVAANLELTDTPLKPAFERAQRHYYAVNDNLDMGLNWLLPKSGLVFHNGMTGGYNSFVAFSKTDKFGLVVLADTTIGGTGGLLDRVAMSFIRAVTEGKPREPPLIRATAPIDAALLQKYAGKYSLIPLVSTFTITSEDNKLYAQLTGQPSIRIYPESETDFFYKVVDARLTFESDTDGNVTRLILHQNGKDLPAAREK